MSAVNTFDAWYERLSDEDKQKILKHIFDEKLFITNEGYHAGPAGEFVKGIFSAPSGMFYTQARCKLCGK
ncbi:hypothetical protein [Pseudomonas sp. NFX15]|uniref:hypothetical protein n=1 Tax=Pseudomonas sp. NFX15 TaxID=2816958 RepID=UPI003B8B21DB